MDTVHHVRAGAGAPMVFLHNDGSSHRVWEPQLAHFAGSHEVFALDMPGFGDSAKPHVGYTLEGYVRMLGQFLDTHGLDDVTLVGNCMGSATALRYAAEHPERVNAVVAINVLSPATISRGLAGPLVRLALRSGRTAAAIGRRRLPGVLARTVVAAQHSGPLTPEQLTHLRARYHDPDQSRVLMSLAANMRTFGVLDRDGGPDDVPVLVIWGVHNRVLPWRAGARLCRTLRPTRLTTLPGGHLVMLEQPDAVNQEIASFVTAVVR
jgi:pimeloyl-ACP methyl ester carboxylesterase